MNSMEKRNICRAVTFYNNFLPASNVSQPWEYCAFGEVDGIDVSDDIAEGGGMLPNCIWEEQKKSVHKLKGECTAQQIYILKNDFPQKEADFWSDQSCPFLFFLRIQCNGDKDALFENKEALEECLQIEDEIKTEIYLTYDNSDLFVVMKAKFYEQGAGMIHTFHQRVDFSMDGSKNCYLKSSFTIFAIKHTWIEDMKKETEKSLITKNIEEVLIKVIEREGGGIHNIIEELEKRKEDSFKNKDTKIDRSPILGAEDELISIKNICWLDLFSLYKKIDGVFCNSNKIYHDNMAGATTIIRTKLVDYTESLKGKGMRFLCPVSGGRASAEISEVYNNQVKGLLDRLNAIHSDVEDFKELRLILNALSKFGGEVFNDYIFFPTIGSIDALLKILEEDRNKNLDKRYFFDFLRGFSMYIQGSVRSDRHSMQAMDFNTKIYDIPSKFNAFYCAFIYHVKEILGGEQNQGESHKYDFLLVPGMGSFVNVIELYQKALPERHLMKVEIPEYNFYNMHDMMIILSHEAAHYVGGKYRKRESRYEAIVESYAHIYVCYVCHYLKKNEITLQSEKVERIELRARKVLISALERELNQEYLEKVKIDDVSEEQYRRILDHNRIYQHYFSVLLRNIDEVMIDIIQYEIGNIFSPILYERDERAQQKIRAVITAASERFLTKHEEGSTLLSSSTALTAMQMLYEESFADLMSILLLHVNVKDYVNCILHNARQQGMEAEQLCQSEIVYRIVVVLLCVIELKVDEIDINHIFDSFSGEDAEGKLVLKKSIYMWNIRKKQPSDIYLERDYGKDVTNVHRDAFIFKKAKEYLLGCCEEFLKDADEKAGDIGRLRNIFKQISNSSGVSIEKQMTSIMKFIEEYRKKTLGELDNNRKSDV